MKIRCIDSDLGLLNSTTRIPFRYGSVVLVHCPQATMRVRIEVGGSVQSGYSGDCLPPGWFDKSPDKDYRQQIDEMLAMIDGAQSAFADAFRHERPFFDGWLETHERVHQHAKSEGQTPLLASFAVSLSERAAIDAILRAAGQPFAAGVRGNLLAIDPGRIHPSLGGLQPRDWLPPQPLDFILVRHTVGLGDPLTAVDDQPDAVDDGFPRTLEQYVAKGQVRCFKIKVANRLDADIARLTAIAEIVERHRGAEYLVTLDGNEQYKQAEQFDELIAAIAANRRLQTLWKNTYCVEQPLDRRIALHADATGAIRRLSETKPVIIDESDGELDSYDQALQLGYRGVSSKNCKGPIKSLLNAGLTWLKNDRGANDDFLMTGEDLCSVGIVPVQADLCLAATLGLKHVERNGHHYHRGLSYLPQAQQAAALSAHPDFYAVQFGRIAPLLSDGGFHIRSLHGPGFGFAVEPDLAAMQTPRQWSFDSLGV